MQGKLYTSFFKRLIDIVVALMALLALSPLLLLVSLLLLVANRGAGVVFSQPRVGLHGRIFNMLKFKTMTDARDSQGNLLSDQQRLTPAGRFLRLTSIDELPQLFNILKGDMSLIGPRPLLVRYMPYYTEEENRRHDLRGGITGLAQVNGRKNISWSEKLHYDVQYVDNCSFLLDCRILWQTIVKVLKHDGVGIETSGTNDFSVYRQRQWDDGSCPRPATIQSTEHIRPQ